MIESPPLRRQTRQRSAIMQALEQVGAFRSAQWLHDWLRDHGQACGLATVYRSLQQMADAGLVDTLRATQGGEQLFRLCKGEQHHHHLTCLECGQAEEIADLVVENWATKVAQTHGYRIAQHTVELTGLCPQCQKETNQ